MKKSKIYLLTLPPSHLVVKRLKVIGALLHQIATLVWQSVKVKSSCNVKCALLQVSATLFRQHLKLKSPLLHQTSQSPCYDKMSI